MVRQIRIWFKYHLYSVRNCTCNHGDFLVLLDNGFGLLIGLDGELALAFVDEKAAGSSYVDGFPDLHVLQILRHLATVGKLGVHVLEVDLFKNIFKKRKNLIRCWCGGNDN